MHYGTTAVLLFLVATVVALVARRVRVPYTVALVVAGLALGATKVLAVPPLTRELLFALFLPGLLFEAAFHLEFREFWRDRLTLGALAVPGVVAAMALIAVSLVPAMRLLGVPAATTAGLGTPAVLLFAALISATDPVAVVALFRTLAAPRRLTVLVEGESLLNDGTAIIFFTLALGALAGPVSLDRLVVDFVYVVGVGALAGAAAGAAGAALIRRVDEPTVEIMITTVVAYGSFVAAEALHASGVIATVTAGMLGGSRAARRALSAPARVAVVTFWEYLAFALNSVVFLLIGLVVRVPALVASWRAIVAAYLVVTASRVVVTAALAAVLPRPLCLPRRWTPLLAWGGLRGALSMVLALAIPEMVGPLGARDTLVTVTFGVVILSIVLQGLTVGPALRWLGVADARSSESPYAATRRALVDAHAVLQELERTAEDHGAPDAEHRALAESSIAHLRRAVDELSAAAERARRDVLPVAPERGSPAGD